MYMCSVHQCRAQKAVQEQSQPLHGYLKDCPPYASSTEQKA